MDLRKLSKNWEWRWPSNTNGGAHSDSASRNGEHSNQTTAERQAIIERDNSRRQIMQEKGAHYQQKLKTSMTRNRLDKLSQRFPYDNGYRTRKTTVSLGANPITLEDVMRLNNQKKSGSKTWEVYFGNTDMKGNTSKGLIHGGNRSRTDNVLGMNERRPLADMNESKHEGEMVFDEDDYNGDSHVPVPRSPIKEIQRTFVEDDVPNRNFGDNYDPVRPRYLPRTGEVRTSFPIKLDKRRVIYKGISEEDVKIRRQREGKLEEESDWRAELNKSYARNFGKYDSSEKDNAYQRASSAYNESRKSESRSAINSRPRQEVRSSSEEEVDDHSEGYARRYGVPEVAFTSQEIIEETQLKYQYTMSAKEGQDNRSGSYPGWKLPSQALDSQRVSAGDTYDRRTPSASSSRAQEQPSSSWMELSKGTGFFQPAADVRARLGQKNQGTSPVNEGYVTKEGNIDVRSYDSRFELGRNESRFADEIYKLDYFYRLQKRQTEEKHGIEYFGFLLEFWPKDAPDLTEVVFGYQMTDEAKAQDSVFAAGLMRLKNTNKINAEAIRARKIEKAKARGYLHRQDPIYSALGPASTFESSYVKPNQYAAEISEEDKFQRTSTSIDGDRYCDYGKAEGEDYLTRREEKRSHLTERKTNSYPEEKETDPHYKSYAAKRTEAIEREEARSYVTERKADIYYPEEKETNPRYESNTVKRTEAIEREEARSYSTERKSDTYYPEEKETDFTSRYESCLPKRTEAIKKDKEDNFRIAIPRGPSIVWDTRRGGSVERSKSRYGLGYQGRK